MPAQAFGLVLVAASCAACHDEPPVRSVSARAQAVRVETFDPPPGARWIAELEVSDGQGCGIGGQRGSLGNALGALREQAARRGASFVKLSVLTKPYSGHDCYHQEYTLRGSAYAMPGALPTPNEQAASTTCAPPCSPGYACSSSGACVALCNPACAAHELCRSDRVCVPMAAQ